ncbi:hypothetical protein TWF506_005724 [Arthrobotrys conoides]|uniref:Uncharacterized protein n=1 Tax=Arthrobotrys conoides TaxID=74498 RepID=A0AAN8NJS5_9PEZI
MFASVWPSLENEMSFDGGWSIKIDDTTRSADRTLVRIVSTPVESMLAIVICERDVRVGEGNLIIKVPISGEKIADIPLLSVLLPIQSSPAYAKGVLYMYISSYLS